MGMGGGEAIEQVVVIVHKINNTVVTVVATCLALNQGSVTIIRTTTGYLFVVGFFPSILGRGYDPIYFSWYWK